MPDAKEAEGDATVRDRAARRVRCPGKVLCETKVEIQSPFAKLSRGVSMWASSYSTPRSVALETHLVPSLRMCATSRTFGELLLAVLADEPVTARGLEFLDVGWDSQ
jgi:hypothetical protein